jgi:HK97 family phage major capsid protein
MPTDKLCDLQQKRTALYNEARELVERSEKENRGLTKDEELRHVTLCGNARDQNGEIFEIDKRITNLQRLNSLDRIGNDPNYGKDPAEARALSDPLPHEDPKNTKDGKHKYSLMRAAKAKLEGYLDRTIEGEVSAELAKRSESDCRANGFKMPYSTTSRSFAYSDRVKRALDSGAGAGSVPTKLSEDWIELLRNKMICMLAGASEIVDLKGKFAIPRQNAAGTAYWVAESAAPTGSNQTLDQVLFTPKTLGAFTDISRRFFELTILESGDEFVKQDLTAIIGRGGDLAALNGPGNAFTPLGILQNAGITSTRTVSGGTNGGVPTWANLVEMHTIVARGNAGDLGPTAYVGNADVEGTLATTLKIGSTFPIYLLDDEGRVYRKPLLTTMQLPNNLTKGSGSSLSPLIYGVWNQLYFAYWSGVDILVDPYTGSNTGTVRIVALQDMDIQVRHNEAFSVIADMITNQSQ